MQSIVVASVRHNTIRCREACVEELLKLENVVEQLRLELKALQRKALDANEPIRFAVEAAEIEFQVVVTKDARASTGVSINIPTLFTAELGGEGGLSKAQTQTLRLRLRPEMSAPGKTASDDSTTEAPETEGASSEREVYINR